MMVLPAVFEIHRPLGRLEEVKLAPAIWSGLIFGTALMRSNDVHHHHP